MAIVSGNVIGNLRGRLGNLAARTINGKTVLSARPSSYNASQEPASLEVRSKFAVTANFAKNILTLPTLEEIWKRTKEAGISVFNAIFKANFSYSSTEKPTEQNILAPEGFPLQITTATVDESKITGVIPALNSFTIFGADEINLSVNALVCYHNPISESDEPFKMISLSKEITGFNFAQSYNLQMDYNILQEAIAAKYGKSILYIAVASKDAAGKIIQYSSTFSKASV